MNQHAATAERQWRRWLPSRVAAIDDPGSLLLNLGEEVAARDRGADGGPGRGRPPGETFTAKVGSDRPAWITGREFVVDGGEFPTRMKDGTVENRIPS